MKINKNSNFYPEDMVPYSIVRDHLRYDYGDAEELVKSYVASACDYMETLTNRVFSSTTPEQHETAEDTFNATPAALNGSAVVYLDENDILAIQSLRNVTGDWTVVSKEYLDENGTYVTLSDTKARVRNTGYPIQVDFTDIEVPTDINTDQDYDLYRVTLSGGDNVKDLPRQYRQAMLLLVGHYDSQREAEYVGGLTTEIKEGVQRLLATVKVY